MDNFIYDRIYEYINNEMNYIEKYDFDNCKNDYVYLKSLSDSDIKDIFNKVIKDGALEGEIENLIDERIHYYLYHNEKRTESDK